MLIRIIFLVTKFLHLWAIAVVVAMGFLITLFAATFMQQVEQQNIKANFMQVVADDIFAIRTTLHWYLEPLEAVAAFYRVSSSFTRQEFSTFVKPFLESRPAIASIQWIPYVPIAQRATYEATLGNGTTTIRDSAPFTFTEYRGNDLIPARTRAEYYPIYYAEPLNKAEAPLGFDLGSDPIIRATLHRARDGAQIIAHEQVSFAEKNAPQQIIIQLFYPIYKVDALTSTMQNPGINFLGFVSIVLRVHEVVATALTELTPDDVHLDIYENFALPEQRQLYHYPPLAHDPLTTVKAHQLIWNGEQTGNELLVTESFTIGGKEWQVVGQPTAMYVAKNQRWYHWFVWIAGLLLTGTLTNYLVLLINRNHQVESRVTKQTDQLRQVNQQLQDALQELQFQKTLLECTSEAAQDGILVVSSNRQWLFFNQRFVDMWQIPQEIAARGSSAEGIPWVVAQVANPQKSRQNIEDLYAHPDATSYDEIILKTGAVFERFSAPVKRSDGMIYGRVWYFRDISLRKKNGRSVAPK